MVILDSPPKQRNSSRETNDDVIFISQTSSTDFIDLTQVEDSAPKTAVAGRSGPIFIDLTKANQPDVDESDDDIVMTQDCNICMDSVVLNDKAGNKAYCLKCHHVRPSSYFHFIMHSVIVSIASKLGSNLLRRIHLQNFR